MYGFEGLGLSEVQLSISEPSVVDLAGGGWTRQTHFMVGPGRGPTKSTQKVLKKELRKMLKNVLSKCSKEYHSYHS